MKTNFILVSLFITFFTLTANSQITKGNWMVGGDISFSSFQTIRDDGYKNDTNSLYISPSLGFFIKDKFAIGSKIAISYIGNGSDNYAFTPFTRYYFLESNKMYNCFLEVRAGYGFGFSRHDDRTYNLNRYGIKSGIVVFLNQSVGFEFSLDYSHLNNITQEVDTNYLKIGFGLQIHLEKDK